MKVKSKSACVEPLESRIAPANTMFIGAPDGTLFDTPKDTEYIEANPSPEFQTKFFVNAATSSDAISGALGVPLPAPGGKFTEFFVRLDAGDEIQGFTEAQSYGSLVKVNKGSAIAFFVDYNQNNDYDPGEFSGLALGANADVTIGAKINGDIVTNLNEHGTKTADDDTLDMSGLVNAKQGIAKLEVRAGSVFGSIYSGGDIKSLYVVNNVEKVLAGQAANGATFDFFGPKSVGSPDPVGGSGTISVNTAAKQVGASISNAIIGSLGLDPLAGPYKSKTGNLEAGGGGFGAAGGSLTNIQILKDSDGFQLYAGEGGSGNAGLNIANGGAGGSLTNIYVSGVSDNSPNSPQATTASQPLVGLQPGVVIHSGDGGDGTNSGKGGDGGKATGVFVGYELNGTTRISSGNLLSDNVLVGSGDGGSGKTGGLGGAISNALVRVQTPDVNADEVAIIAGAGGSSVDPAGKAGAGGSITGVDARNQVSTFNADIVLHAGDAGNTVGAGIGAAGGSITKSTVLSFDQQIIAGNGSDGKTGGAGGSISAITIADGTAGSRDVVAHNVLLNAGKGGNATNGAGGAGGSITTINASKTDIQVFLVNTGIQGDGGSALGGKGGVGGSVSVLNVNDTDTGFGLAGGFNIRAGSGGDGSKGGGNAGQIQKTLLSGIDTNFTISGGVGGDSTLLGSGGAGGGVSASQFGATGDVQGIAVFGNVSAGAGGVGRGKGGAGGAGGAVQTTNVNVDGSVAIAAGDGGSGDDILGGGAAGRGGSVLVTGGFGLTGSGEIHAGNAGAGGAKAGIGGSVIGNGNASVSGLLARTDVSITAGNGSNGGAGGDIKNIGYGSTFSSLSPTPSGNILIQAGNGSAEGKVAGKGGSLDSIFGSVSSGVGLTTKFNGGNGGKADFFLGQVTTVPGDNATSEVQTIDRSALANTPTGTFTLSFTNGAVTSTTAPLTFASTIAEIDTALEGLASVQALAGPANNKVSVAQSVDGKTLTVTFNGFQDVNPLVAKANVGVLGGDGGSVTNISISLGGAKNGVLTVQAGDAGNANGAAKGAKGGDVRGVGVIGLDPQTIFRSVAAGNGGDAAKTGGLGGSVDQIAVQKEDIGLRTGAVFGFNTMGGIFVGTGGNALAIGGKVGLAGSATNINADSIASIVAGRDLVPQFAEKVANVYLNGDHRLLQRDGAFTENGPFVLSFGGDQTPTIGKNATPAVVQQNLNALPSVSAAGGVTVIGGPIVNGSPTYKVQWNLPGDRAPIVASEEQPAEVTETTKGQIIDFSTGEVVTGAVVLPVTESIPGQSNLSVVETVQGDTPVIATEVTAGDAITQEVQQINVFAITPYLNGQLQFSFGGEKTGFLPQNASPQAVENALNSLLTIQALGNSVTVSQSVAFVYTITFNVADDITDLVVADLIIPETQRLNIGALAGFPGGQFDLSFKNQSPGTESETQTTALLPSGANKTQIENALNNLSAVQNAGGVTVTDGPGGTFNVQFGDIGDQLPLIAHGYVHEQQTIDASKVLPTGTIQLGYGGQFTTVAANAQPIDVQNALNQLDTVKATGPGGTGSVTVGAGGAALYTVSFNTNGDKLPISAVGLQHEKQSLDLGTVGSAPTGEYLLTVKHNVPVFEGVKGVETPFTVTDLIEGANGFVTVTTLADGAANQKETQEIDITGVAGIVGGEFLLTFNGKTTDYIPNTATAQDIADALNLAPVSAGVTVTQPDPLNPFLFDVVFNANGNKPQITASAGARELQNLDIDLLANDPTGEFVIHFLGQTTDPLASTATPADVEAALNALSFVQLNGGVDVTAGPGTTHSFDVQFQQFGDVAKLTSEGGGDTSHESQLIDLSKFTGVANTTYTLVFGNAATTPLTGTSTVADIQNALNALPSVKATRSDNSGSVTVTETAPGSGKFAVAFDIFGDQPSIAGSGVLGSGQTIRLDHGATASQVETEINKVSLANVTVTNGTAPGTFNFEFNENADQPVVAVTGFIHEVQKVDIFVTGDFVLRFGGNSTGPLPATATAADVKAALEQLPSIQNLTPNADDVKVTAGADSSFQVVLLGDGDLSSISGVQTGAMLVTTTANGTANTPEIQQIAYPVRGNFSDTTFATANLVGGISDSNELGANIFKWTEVNGIPGFNLGDIPIDGLVMAKFFDQNTVNFTPEAKLTTTGFFDNDNRI